MSKQVYIDSILRPVVVSWCQQVKRRKIDPFILEEDGDSRHGTEAQSCIVKKFKAKEGINTYRNCASLSDLAPIEIAGSLPSRY